METAAPPADVQYFCSLGQLYAGSETSDLQLTVTKLGNDSIAIELLNLNFKQQRWKKCKNLLATLTLYIAYSQMLQQRLLLDIGFVLYLLYATFRLFALVESEKCLFCLDFALQRQTVRLFSRVSNLFIPAANIHDIVINEVIENLDVHYLLIVRTKGRLFKQKPIIPIFNNLRPPLPCLEVIYKYLNKVLQKNVNI